LRIGDGYTGPEMVSTTAWVAAAAVLSIGLALTAAAVIWQQRQAGTEARAQQERQVERLQADIVKRLATPVYGLKGARGALAALEGRLNRAAFDAYVESRDLPHEFPGARGFGFIERVARRDLDAFVAAHQREGATEFRVHGSQYPAYGSIVAAGANACVLHYRADAAPVRNGELVLIDAGCELDGYASDITRTFPANGKFTGPQRALYDLVLASQDAAAAATKAGNRFNDPHDAAVRVLAQGMLDFGLLDANKVGSVDDVIDKRAYFQFYMHRTGHWLGMDVHDCGSYVEPTQVGEVSERKDPLSNEVIKNRPSRILHPGMVLTLEPGIYVRPAEGVPEQFHNIGIRIEDDAIVTATGCELISRGVPVKADEIEALMRA